MAGRAQRSRDPEGRREEILAAAEVVIAEVGIERATHRLIAERAGVALGSTTYYFPTRRDLVAAALERATRVLREELARWTDVLRDAGDVPSALAGLIHEYLQDQTPQRLRPSSTSAPAAIPTSGPSRSSGSTDSLRYSRRMRILSPRQR
ncbi:TetR/AcrR family transcriptional regulator [Blastococcus aggregatus]|uniref:TetR/AcrR family transcriptional regulator n=1 Tax=Blastococcus aggregatus TaxID=38502 RepID=UPI000BE2999F|nr:TetR family transcriptional regulator [Blastococcus aggregatus]